LGSRELKKIRHEDDSMKLEAEYMTYLKEGTYWEFVNSKISVFVLQRFYCHERQFAGPLAIPEASKNWWVMRVEEFFRVNDLISLRLFEEIYGNGAAHPNRRTHTLNFCGAPLGAFSLRDLLQRDLERLNFVREYCETDIKRQFLSDNEQQWPLPTEEERLWDVFSDFNFDSEGLTFNFPPYTFTSYASGQQEVMIPWHAVSSRISPPFKASPLGSISARPRPIPASVRG
jgi:hypothetical protein